MEDRKEQLKKRGSKSRLSKQDEVEEMDDIHIASHGGSSDTTLKQVKDTDEELLIASGLIADMRELQIPPDLLNSAGEEGPKIRVVELVLNEDYDENAISRTSVEICRPFMSPDSSEDSSLQEDKGLKGLLKDSSQGSESSSASGISRDSSFDAYKDSSGIDLEEFIKSMLNKNRQDSLYMLKLEKDLTSFVNSSPADCTHLKFGPMSSYHRMMVHRVSAFYGLEHNVDQSGHCVLVNRSENSRIPDFKFSDHITKKIDVQPKVILKKKGYSEEGRLGDQLGLEVRRKCKSFEERAVEYHQVRKRIFNNVEITDYPDTKPIVKPVAVLASSSSHWPGGEGGRPWRSTETSSDDSLKVRVQVTKASSFGGVTTKANSVAVCADIHDSRSSGISSKGGSTNRLATECFPYGNSPGHRDFPQLLPCYYGNEGPKAMWVCTDLNMVPHGSIIINPITRHPYLNVDGSPVRWGQTDFDFDLRKIMKDSANFIQLSAGQGRPGPGGDGSSYMSPKVTEAPTPVIYSGPPGPYMFPPPISTVTGGAPPQGYQDYYMSGQHQAPVASTTPQFAGSVYMSPQAASTSMAATTPQYYAPANVQSPGVEGAVGGSMPQFSTNIPIVPTQAVYFQPNVSYQATLIRPVQPTFGVTTASQQVSQVYRLSQGATMCVREQQQPGGFTMAAAAVQQQMMVEGVDQRRAVPTPPTPTVFTPVYALPTCATSQMCMGQSQVVRLSPQHQLSTQHHMMMAAGSPSAFRSHAALRIPSPAGFVQGQQGAVVNRIWNVEQREGTGVTPSSQTNSNIQ